MKTIPAQLLADLRKDQTSQAFLWAIEMKDGRVIRGTDHDMDITIPTTGDSPTDQYAGTYYTASSITPGDIASTADMSVSNLDVIGKIQEQGATLIDVSVDDIESGLLDAAPVSVLICNWRQPSHGYFIAKRGFLGAISRDSDLKYTTEVRSLSQLLSQVVVQTYSTSCNVVRLGDARCKFDVSLATVSGHVVSQTSRQKFTVELDQPSPFSYSFANGTITFSSGENKDFFREVKIDPNGNGGILVTWDELPADMAPGDTFSLVAGCPRTRDACKDTFNNLVNMRAYGLFIPGLLAITAGPTQAQ